LSGMPFPENFSPPDRQSARHGARRARAARCAHGALNTVRFREGVVRMTQGGEVLVYSGF